MHCNLLLLEMLSTKCRLWYEEGQGQIMVVLPGASAAYTHQSTQDTIAQ